MHGGVTPKVQTVYGVFKRFMVYLMLFLVGLDLVNVCFYYSYNIILLYGYK